jgi:alpha-L-fucosidase
MTGAKRTLGLTWLFMGGLICPRFAAGDAGAPTGSLGISWWREARFGMFIHWGPVSIKGTEIGWSRGAPIPIAEYDNLYKQFNPVKFNADEWVGIAKAAGMKYMIFTTKHHDGFCMFDTKQTDYNIMNSPFGRDVVKELAEACRKGGIAFGTYHSVCDWHHPDFPHGSPGGKSLKPNPNLDRYEQYLKNQVKELITQYGPLLVLWFDVAQDFDAARGKRVVDFTRSLQPGIIINNRCANPGDYDTPEQTVGGFLNTRPWESCITICNQWAWKPKDQMKSLKVCLRTLVNCAGGDGNLLFNVGPMPTGEIEPRQVARLKEMGEWLAKYGQSVYATRGGPFKPGPWGASTHKGDTIYVHIYPQDNKDHVVKLPPISRRIVSSEILTGGTCEVRQTDKSIEITIPAADLKEIDTLVALKLDGPAADIKPIRVASTSDSVSLDKPARASNVHQKQTEYGADKAFDDDPGTRWATDAGTHSAWIEVDLGKETTIDHATISESCGDRVRKFELQSREGDEYKTFFKGTTIGEKKRLKFDPVKVRIVRLNILEATEGPTIWEIQLFAPKP